MKLLRYLFHKTTLKWFLTLLLLNSQTLRAQNSVSANKKAAWGTEFYSVWFYDYATYHHLGMAIQYKNSLISFGGLFGYESQENNWTYDNGSNYFKIGHHYGAYIKDQYSVFSIKRRFNMSFSTLIEYALQKSEYGISVLDMDSTIYNLRSQSYAHQLNLGIGVGFTYRLIDQLYLNGEVLCEFSIAGVTNFQNTNSKTNSETHEQFTSEFVSINGNNYIFPKLGIYYLFPNRSKHQ